MNRRRKRAKMEALGTSHDEREREREGDEIAIARSEVITTSSLKIQTFWDVTFSSCMNSFFVIIRT